MNRIIQSIGLTWLFFFLLLLSVAEAHNTVKKNKKQSIAQRMQTKQKVKKLQNKILKLQEKYIKAYNKYRRYHTLWIMEKLKCDPKFLKDYKRMKSAPDMYRAYHSR